MSAELRTARPRRILVRGVNWLGDAVMTTPALQRLRERFPDAQITLLTPEKLAALWQQHPSLDNVLTFAPGESPWSIARRLRSEAFELALVFPNSPRSALEMWLARIPCRVGYARSWRNWFLTHPIATRPGHVAMHKRSEAEIQRLLRAVERGAWSVERGPRGFSLSSAGGDGRREVPQSQSLPHCPPETPHPPSGHPLPLGGGEGRGEMPQGQPLPHCPLEPPHPPSGHPLPRRGGEGRGEGALQLARVHGEEAASSRGPHATPNPAHQLHEYLYLAAALGASPEPLPPHLAITPKEIAAAVSKFKLPGGAGDSRPVFGLNPGAEYGPAKRWPLERFIAAAQALHARTGCLWLIFGGPADVPAAQALHSALRTPHAALCVAGQTSLRELMALLKRCRVLLTNDTGPMHVAAALGTPVVVPFGSTAPDLTGPGLPGDSRHRLLRFPVPCAPCFRRVCPVDFRCMTGIGVEQVVEAVLQVA